MVDVDSPTRTPPATGGFTWSSHHSRSRGCGDRLTGLTTASMTGLIDRLEKAEFVTRVRHATDRRRVLIHLNDARARADIAPLYGPLLGTWRRALSAYTVEELTLITDFLARVEEGFDQALGPQEG
ncbi:MarR family winged helix-turn-helix transcriptional regulator [Nocardia africana]|nr:MarR family transcriptional regulator [Nocardia africana]MCC3314342.1 MarR family transcriptional regulator [Nocardia africana]